MAFLAKFSDFVGLAFISHSVLFTWLQKIYFNGRAAVSHFNLPRDRMFLIQVIRPVAAWFQFRHATFQGNVYIWVSHSEISTRESSKCENGNTLPTRLDGKKEVLAWDRLPLRFTTVFLTTDILIISQLVWTMKIFYEEVIFLINVIILYSNIFHIYRVLLFKNKEETLFMSSNKTKKYLHNFKYSNNIVRIIILMDCKNHSLNFYIALW